MLFEEKQPNPRSQGIEKKQDAEHNAERKRVPRAGGNPVGQRLAIVRADGEKFFHRGMIAASGLKSIAKRGVDH